MKKQLLKKLYYIFIYILLFILFIASTISYQTASINDKSPNILIPNSYYSSAIFLDTPLCLVNTNHYLNKDYIPSNLVNVNSFDIDYIKRDEDIYLNKEALLNLSKMIYDMNKESLNICIFSGYRSYEKQKGLKTIDATFEVAKEGHSEHQLGLAVDVSLREIGLTCDFSKTLEYKWLYHNSYKYGFILRYLSEISNTTGIPFEPWHLRYVSLEHSLIIKNEMSLEEYINKNF